tara:strand:+ start:512 stop:697 length:186 start_codon:yes stop_codon:yes gene_type:complete
MRKTANSLGEKIVKDIKRRAQTGRTHDCFWQMHKSDQKRLAKQEPSTPDISSKSPNDGQVC